MFFDYNSDTQSSGHYYIDDTPLYRHSPADMGLVQEQTRRLEFALLVQQAMWSILRDHVNVTDEDLVIRINELDIGDGFFDGQKQKSIVACPTCNRTISPRSNRCMYCGQPVMQDPFA